MKFLLIALGSYGDVLPFVGIGRQLVQDGHDVQLACNLYFKELLTDTGLKHVPLGTVKEYQDFTNERDLFTQVKGPSIIAKHVTARLGPVFELAKNAMENDRIVAGGILAMGARIAQEVTGKPYVVVHFAPAVFWSVESPPKFPMPCTFAGEPKFLIRATYRLMGRLADLEVAPALNKFRSKFGLRPVKHVWANWLHSPTKNLCLFPDWFARPQSDWPANSVTTSFPLFDKVSEFAGAKELDDFLASGDKPIVFTPGTGYAFAQDFFKVAADVVNTLKARAIFATTFPEKLPKNLGPNIHVSKYAPFSDLLPRCALFVHHGGIGSTAQGFAAGIPQLLKPIAFDQFDNGMRIEKLGVGSVLPHKKWHASKALKTISHLLTDPKFQQASERAKALTDKMDGVRLACSSLTGNNQPA